jgi:phosphonate transport system ATP-binding protein
MLQRFLKAFFLLILTLGTAGAQPPEPKREIVIGLNPSERAENVQKNADLLAQMIGQRAGIPVKMFVAHDYSGLVEALRGRTIDFAFFAPLTYIFAEKIADARVLLKAERRGRPYYYGCIIVNADSSYRTLADLKGKEIAWVDPTSTSGHIYPKAALKSLGIDPDTYFGKQTFAGGHDKVVLSVINGTIAAGATYCNDTLGESGSWTQLGDGAYNRKVRPIFFSPPIPGDNMATSQFMLDAYPQLVRKVTAAVQSLTADSAGKALMQQMYHVDAMIPATSADYDPVRRAAELMNLDITGKVRSGEGAPTDSASAAKANQRQQERAKNAMISYIVLAIGLVAGVIALTWLTLRERRNRRALVRETSAGAAAPANSSTAQYLLQNLSVVYRDSKGGEFTAMRGVNLEINRGEFIAVIGLSGAGKSTFLRCLNRMNEPSAGTLLFNGKDITHAAGAQIVEVRRQVGFVFQQFNLVKTITVLQNVLTGRLSRTGWFNSMIGRYSRQDRQLAVRYLTEVGLADKLNNRADRLSGGQQQRVAIARALAQQPNVILADEPMASLDPKLSEVVLQILQRFNRQESITVIVNLHVLELARRYADRIIAFRKGEVAFDGKPDELTPEIIEAIYRMENEELHRL